MAFEQLHFAFGASIPLIISGFFYNRKFIFYLPLIMTITGTLAFLPYFAGWSGGWTNIFFLYDLIHSRFNSGQFLGFISIVIMYSVVLWWQALYLWRKKYA
ncbi:MAG: hypothetical protein V3V78_00905 [Candidatus Woesearchaeota archaeon]